MPLHPGAPRFAPLLALALALPLAACGSSGGSPADGGPTGGGGSSGAVCAEVAPTPLAITGVDDTPGMLSVLDARADANGPFFLFMQTLGDIATRTISLGLGRRGGGPTTVYMQGQTIPEGAGLYGDATGKACAIVSTSSASYVQCEGGAQMSTGLDEIATTNGFSTSRIVSAAASDGSLEFFTYGPFAAISGVTLSGAGTFGSVEFFESSISFPGAAAAAGGLPYACIIGSDDALGVVNPARVAARTRSAAAYRDCRMASDGTRLYVAGVTDIDGSYAVFTPTITLGSTSAVDLPVVPLAIDQGSPFDVVFFGGKPRLVRRDDASGDLRLSEIAADGALGTPRVLAANTDGWPGVTAVGPDGGLHVVFDAGGHVSYAKRCP